MTEFQRDEITNLVDIGANLAHDSFDHDLRDVVTRAAAAGVKRIIVTGTSIEMSYKAQQLAASYPGVLYATAGIHPHDSSTFNEASLESLLELSKGNHVVAIGECGLDYFRDYSPRDIQRHAFEAQLELAVETDLPVFLHQRDAHEDFTRIISRYRSKLSGGVAHCFTGGPDELAAYLDLDLFIGVTGWICDERRSDALRAALPGIPLDRLLLETDAPYLLPRNLDPKPRTRRNEPAYLRHILESVALGIERSADEVADAASRNTQWLFKLDDGSTGRLNA